MAKAIMVMFPIPAAKRLIGELEKANFEVVTASWLYNREDDEWKLMIASPFIEKKGELEGYRLIQKILRDLPQDPEESLRPLTLQDIDLYGAKSRFIKRFRKSVHVGLEEAPKLVRLSSMEGVPVDEAYVYRSL